MATRRKVNNLERRLIEASANDNMSLVVLLIANGVDANATDPDGRTALHHITRQNDAEGVRFLVGEERQTTGRYGIMYRGIAALDENAAHEFALNVSSVNLADNEGNRAIHFAALNDNSEIIGILASHGGNIDAKNNAGATALHYAARHGHMHALVEITRLEADIDARDKEGMAPIHYAANSNRIDAARYLKKIGADIASLNNSGNSPYELALWQGYERMAKMLRG